MSLSIKCQIECSVCHKEGEFERWDSINVDLNPELREKLFSGEIFTFRCPHCGNEMRIPYPILYHNMGLKFMVFFEPFVPEDGPEDYIEIPDNLGNIWTDYTIRKVYGYLEFLEKVKLFERGLRDIAMERTKYMVSHFHKPELAEQNADLIVTGFTKETEDCPYGEMLINAYASCGDLLGTLKLRMETYYENEHACKYDKRMQIRERQVLVDKSWIDLQLHKL